MRLSRLVLLVVVHVILFYSCSKQSLEGTFYLSPMSQIVLSKNESNLLQLEHFYIDDSDSFSVFGPPMIEYQAIENKRFFKNKSFSASVEKISDSIMIYEFSKLAGEIDEVYFIKNNVKKIDSAWYENYCQKVTKSNYNFTIDESFFGLVFLVFSQESEESFLIDDNLVILTSEKLDLECFMTKKYRLIKNDIPLNLKWDKYRNISEEVTSSVDGVIWGLNQGPYQDILNKTGSSGEVLVFDLRKSTSMSE